MATRQIVGPTYIDVSEFRQMAQALKKAEPLAYLALKRNLKAAGELIARDARMISSASSTSIPPTIKTRTRGISVYIEAGGNFGGMGAGAQKEALKTMNTIGMARGEGGSGGREAKGLEEGVVIAGLFELGNKGGGSSAASRERGVFRHPTFGSDPWVDQNMHPYLVPAGKKNEAAVAALVVEAMDEVVGSMTTWVGTLGGKRL